MSRNKIVAVTMTAAALGLAFAGYTVTRASGTDEPSKHASNFRPKWDAGYRANHQIGHSGAVFAWMDAAASLNPPLHPQFDEPGIGASPAVTGSNTGSDDGELMPVSLEHANKIGAGFRGFGLAGGGGTSSGSDEWSGGRYASNRGFVGGFVGGIGTFGGAGGGGGSLNGDSKGASGSNDPAGDTPHHDAPSASNANPDDQPGSADPQPDGPPGAAPPSEQNPPAQEESKDPTDPTPGNGDGNPNTGGSPGNGNPPTTVPEPATFGLLGFGMIAAAALRRRRRQLT